MSDPLARFSRATAGWFRDTYSTPTPVQVAAWEAIQQGRDTLVVAPTGSGKTLAAFLWALDRCLTEPAQPGRVRVLYISPLKALAVDVERNLNRPLRQIRARADAPQLRDVRVSVRTGDTPADERRRMLRRAPEVLITTPESLFILMTSSARETLTAVETVIVDEVHALAGNKRGAHLAATLARLTARTGHPPLRVGLSATVRPVAEVARYLGGGAPVSVVAPDQPKAWELSVQVPVPDMTALPELPQRPQVGGPATRGRPGSAARRPPARSGQPGAPGQPSAAAFPAQSSIWPHVENRIVDLISEHTSTIVFANSRRLAERLTARINEIWWERTTGGLPPPAHAPAELMGPAGWAAGTPGVLARAHHGSVSKELRAEIEAALKAGSLPAVVATSSMELGIDMGAVDLVIQVETPPSVAAGLQRIGRGGHHVGAVSRGVLFPKFRADLLASAVVVQAMRAGEIEELRVVDNPLDVLSQQIVAALALDEWEVDRLYDLFRGTANFAELPYSAFTATLDMLAGRYPSAEFAELRPRITWDRSAQRLTGRPGAQRLAITSGGTIPDRGLFPVYLLGAGNSRLGELDEEMVYESRVGDVFALGANGWRIAEITRDRVFVQPAANQAGRLPFWHGDAFGRPAALGARIGQFTRQLSALPRDQAEGLLSQIGLDGFAAANLCDYLSEQKAATEVVPSDRAIVVERNRDELGDWRFFIHSPWGDRVHAPWAQLIGQRLRQAFGVDAQVLHADDGIIARLPDSDNAELASVAAALFLPPEEVQVRVRAGVTSSAMFAARFRECAGRALLLPRRSPGKRSPLWQQRQRAGQLLEVTSKYPQFPIVLEAAREVLDDIYDLSALVELMARVADGRTSVTEVVTQTASPFAQSLLYGYAGVFMYEQDTPLAERRAGALTLDPQLLAELLGEADLRDLLDLESIEQVENELARVAPGWQARDPEGALDALWELGPLDVGAAARRGIQLEWLTALEVSGRAVRVVINGQARYAASEDAARLRDALGASVPSDFAVRAADCGADPLADLLQRFARVHGPFTLADVTAEFRLPPAILKNTLHELTNAGHLLAGGFRPGQRGTEWCSPRSLQLIKRRSLAVLQRAAEPVDAQALARFLTSWQHVWEDPPPIGIIGLRQALTQLQGLPLPWADLEGSILPARVGDYSPAMLDALAASGELTWGGTGNPEQPEWVVLALADSAPLLLPEPRLDQLAAWQRELLEQLGASAGYFAAHLWALAQAAADPPSPSEFIVGLWELVWAGALTNDTFAPFRLRANAKAARAVRPAARTMPRPHGRYAGLAPTHAASQPPDLSTVPGRWSLTVPLESNRTLRAHARAVNLLERNGLVARATAAGEAIAGGFSSIYPVLRAMAEQGGVQRAYAVEGLGAAQFALPGVIDRLRDRARDTPARAVVLAACDPANPFGATLPWPTRTGSSEQIGPRPARRPGALVVLRAGQLIGYLERTGENLLCFPPAEEVLRLSGAGDWADQLASALTGHLARIPYGHAGRTLTIKQLDGAPAISPPPGSAAERAAAALESAGFRVTPSGLRRRDR